MTSKQAKERKAAEEAALIEHDACVAEALDVVKSWDRVDTATANADAKAVHVMVRAHSIAFFGDDANAASWHKIATPEQRKAFADTVLEKLFQVEKPTAADRQRLQRIKIVVPALIRAGGLDVFGMSNTGQVMLETETEYFKACEKSVEATGRMSLSIAKLERGARSYLKEELPKTKRAPKTTREKLAGITNADIAKVLENRVAKLTVDKLTKPEEKVFQHLLVQLVGMFATDDKGEQVDTDKIQELYTAAAS